MKKCLLTGATGLIGENLLSVLQREWLVYGVSRRDLKTNHRNVEHLPMDLSSPWDPKNLPTKIDTVIHLAQSEHFREFPLLSNDVFHVNTVSTLKLLDYARCAGARTFIMASSGGIYGDREQVFNEDQEIYAKKNLGFYLGTKLCSEVLAENYTSFFNVVVLRLFFVYGPDQKQTMLIPRLVRSVLDGKPIILQGKEGIRINPTYVSDAVNAIYSSLELNTSHKINVAGPEVLSMRQIGVIIGQVVGKEPVFENQKDTMPKSIIGDIKKMTRLLWKPVWLFRKGLEQFVRIP